MLRHTNGQEHSVGWYREAAQESSTFPDRLLEALCAGFVAVFAAWTLLCNFAVLNGLSFRELKLLSPVALLLGVLLMLLLVKSKRHGADRGDPPDAAADHDFLWSPPRLGVLAASVVIVVYYALTSEFFTFWLLSCLLLAATYLSSMRKPLSLPPRPSMGWKDVGILAAAASCCIVVTLFSHRPDPDDCHYLSLATGALDWEREPLFTRDFTHGIEGIPAVFPMYRLHSLELMIALVSDVTGIQPLEIGHLYLPAIFAFLIPFCIVRLLRIFLPNTWRYGLAAYLIILLVAADTHRSFGNFAFVRLFQGKAVLVTMVAPLITSYAITFFRQPSIGSWALLALSQVAALGLSSNAIHTAPLAAGIALAACWTPTLKDTQRLLIGVVTAAYPVFMGLLAKSWLVKGMASVNFGVTIKNPQAVLDHVFGSGILLAVSLVSAMGGWSLLRDESKRRWCAGFMLLWLVCFFNPFLNEFWAGTLTGHNQYWRILWCVPIPMFTALLLTSLIEIDPSAERKAVGVAVFVLGLIVFVILVPARYTVSASNGTKLKLPSIKAPPAGYALARAFNEMVPRPGGVLAPEEVSAYIPVIRNHPYPVAARVLHISVLAPWLDQSDVVTRVALARYIGGFAPLEKGPEMLIDYAKNYPAFGVAMKNNNPWRLRIRDSLLDAGFHEVPASNAWPGFEVYIRPGT